MSQPNLIPEGMQLPDTFSYQAGRAAAEDVLKLLGKEATLMHWESAACGFLARYLTLVSATLGQDEAVRSQASLIISLQKPLIVKKSERN